MCVTSVLLRLAALKGLAPRAVQQIQIGEKSICNGTSSQTSSTHETGEDSPLGTALFGRGSFILAQRLQESSSLQRELLMR
jgi:hypothetical protein